MFYLTTLPPRALGAATSLAPSHSTPVEMGDDLKKGRVGQLPKQGLRVGKIVQAQNVSYKLPPAGLSAFIPHR